MKEWKETIIETDVDRLLEYLTKEGEASIEQISNDLGIPEDRIEAWSKALQQENLLNKKYTARTGTILEFTDQSKKELEGKSKEVKEDISKKVEEVKDQTESSSTEVSDAKKKLEKISKIVKKDTKELKKLQQE